MLLLAHAVIMQHADRQNAHRQARRYTRRDPILIAQVDARSPLLQITRESQPDRRQVVIRSAGESRNGWIVLYLLCGGRNNVRLCDEDRSVYAARSERPGKSGRVVAHLARLPLGDTDDDSPPSHAVPSACEIGACFESTRRERSHAETSGRSRRTSCHGPLRKRNRYSTKTMMYEPDRATSPVRTITGTHSS